MTLSPEIEAKITETICECAKSGVHAAFDLAAGGEYEEAEDMAAAVVDSTKKAIKIMLLYFDIEGDAAAGLYEEAAAKAKEIKNL